MKVLGGAFCRTADMSRGQRLERGLFEGQDKGQCAWSLVTEGRGHLCWVSKNDTLPGRERSRNSRGGDQEIRKVSLIKQFIYR